jgi:hypothetical protein
MGILGVGKSAAEVGGDEMGAGDERAPCLENTPEFDDRFHGQSGEDFGDNFIWETV